MSFASKVIGIIAIVGIAFFLAFGIANILLGLGQAVEEDTVDINIESFSVNFEEECNNRNIKVRIEDYEVEGKVNNSNSYVSVFRNNKKIMIGGNQNSILVDVYDSGEIEVVPSIQLENGNVISFYNNSKSFKYNC